MLYELFAALNLLLKFVVLAHECGEIHPRRNRFSRRLHFEDTRGHDDLFASFKLIQELFLDTLLFKSMNINLVSGNPVRIELVLLHLLDFLLKLDLALSNRPFTQPVALWHFNFTLLVVVLLTALIPPSGTLQIFQRLLIALHEVGLHLQWL